MLRRKREGVRKKIILRINLTRSLSLKYFSDCCRFRSAIPIEGVAISSCYRKFFKGVDSGTIFAIFPLSDEGDVRAERAQFRNLESDLFCLH